MINTNSSKGLQNLSFKQGLTQMEKVKCALDQVGPLSDRELSELTDIPRHLLPARRGELVKLGVVKRLKSAYDTETRQTVDVWATASYIDRIMTQRSAEAVKQILAKSERQISKVIVGGLFCLAIFIIIAKPVDAHTIVKKTIVRSPYTKVRVPSSTPTPTIRIQEQKLPTSVTNLPTKYVAPQTSVELPDFKKDVARQIRDAFPNDARTMIAIAMAESGLNCDRINGMDSNGVQSVGLFQINDGRWFSETDIANLTTCSHNIERAKQKYASQTKQAWGAFTNNSYSRYLWIYDQI